MERQLKDHFCLASEIYSPDRALIDEQWKKIVANHQQKTRHYHTLAHLAYMLQELGQAQPYIQDWDSLVFATFFHDLIYDATSKANEEKSAEVARSYLSALGYPTHRINRVVGHILATKKHETSADSDTNYFIDADLAILGSDPESYNEYQAGIRKEYRWFPDLLYKPGRRKVLEGFLAMKNIYKTEIFRKRQDQAIKNIQQEIRQLD
jgi:predicted metal-dependent HD superfamily phosphohydrolase